MGIARTLTGGDKVGMLEVYDCIHEEMVIGPFTYSPMRAVDIWLGQSDQFLLQSLSPCPEAIEEPERFTAQLRDTLRVIKSIHILQSPCSPLTIPEPTGKTQEQVYGLQDLMSTTM